MKKFTWVLMVVSVLGLGACACPHGTIYEGTPYDGERTAGNVQHEEGCLRRSLF